MSEQFRVVRCEPSSPAGSMALIGPDGRALAFTREEDGAKIASAFLAKDAQIKALADALWDARQYGEVPEDLCWCQSPCFATAWRNPKCDGKVATLRLAGRL